MRTGERGSAARFFFFVVVLVTALPTRAADLDSLLNSYLAGYWKARPVLASRFGLHAYDAQLPDLSAAALTAQAARARDFLAQVQRLDPATLTAEQRVDRDMFLRHLERALIEYDQVQSWKKRPDQYVALWRESVEAVAVREYAPAERRFQAAAARLKQMPRSLRDVRPNFDNPPEEATRHAIALAVGTAAFIEKDLPSLAAEQGVTRKLLKRLSRETAAAGSALRAFAQWAQADLLPRSKGSLFPSADVYGRWFRLYLGSEQTPGQVAAAAEIDVQGTRGQMARVVAQIAPGSSVPELLERLSAEHPPGEALASVYRKEAAAVKRFIEEKRLAPLPPLDRLRIQTAPEYAAITRLALDAPGPFEPDAPWYLRVPSPSRLGFEAEDAALRYNNNYSIPLEVIHLLYPGHYVQLDAAYRTPHLARKVFANAAFVTGWAEYCEQMLFDEGFGNGPAARLFQMHRALRSQVEAILDARLHEKTMTTEQAVQFAIEQGYQPPGEAREMVAEILRAPGEHAAGYEGKRQILQLRETMRRRQGPAFVLGEFHEHLVALGAPPVLAARLLLELAETRLEQSSDK